MTPGFSALALSALQDMSGNGISAARSGKSEALSQSNTPIGTRTGSKMELIKKGRGGARVGAGRKAGSLRPQIAEGWYLYAIAEKPASDFLKIGIAHKPYDRLCSAQTSNPRQLVFVGLWSLGGSDTYMAVEKAIHRALSPFHERGEWFAVPFSTIEKHFAEVIESFGIEAKRVL